ncbi:SGNH/GDSL hydrolase family protein [Sinorhizobium phage phiM6]|nr:SGNH/GDSL hydrolase family protein [Sinorhizobium phage phiM6]
MIGFGVGISLTKKKRRDGGGPIVRKMLAHRMYGPGHNAGSALPTGDGTQKTYTNSHNNILNIPLETVSVVLQGWTMRTTGTSDTPNPFTVTGQIEYPSGTIVGTLPSMVVNGGQLAISDDINLTTPIPPGATWVIRLFSTVPLNDKYIVNLGWAGLRVHTTDAASLPKIALMAVGDSIMTNNNGAVYNALNGRCPGYQNSVSGTRASHYGANNAEFFQRQCDLASALGLTHIISNFGTNDYGSGDPLATLQANLLNMKTAANARGVKFVQCTMLPRVSRISAVTATSVTSSGNTMTCVVPDTSLFTVGKPYSISGATQTEYNGSKICTAKDAGAGTVSFLFQGSATTPATGTVTILSWKFTSSPEWTQPFGPEYQPGDSSPRGLLNAWIRAGAFDDYIEWADVVETSRNSNKWLTWGEHANLPDVELITVSSVTSTTRFNSNYSRGSSTIANGFVQALTGPNIGLVRNGNGNTNGDITVTAAWTSTQQVGNQYYAVPGVSYISDDGTHLRVAGGGKGGQVFLDNATIAWVDAKLA